MTQSTAAPSHSASHWPATIGLAFRNDGSTTRMHRLGGYGPLYVQKPFYPEPQVCHAYLLHPPGGVAGGDHLTCEVAVEANSHALLTTPAATKHLRSRGPMSKTHQRLTVADGGTLEYLPQETIVFNGAKATSSTEIALTGSARVIAWDVVALGRPAIAETLQSGSLAQSFRINQWSDERDQMVPLVIDQQRWQGAGGELSAAWGLQANPVLGTLFASPIDADMLHLLRNRTDSEVAMTLINGVLVSRIMGSDTESVTQRLQALWRSLRPMLLQRPAVTPNIWHT